jgi:hypothetical protein
MGNIQRVELRAFYELSLFCPFCGTKVVDMEAVREGGEGYNPCKHTLFIAHDLDFDYRSPRFDEAKGIKGVSNDELMSAEEFTCVDEFTDEFDITDGLKFASYVGPPSGFGSYVAFAPLED